MRSSFYRSAFCARVDGLSYLFAYSSWLETINPLLMVGATPIAGGIKDISLACTKLASGWECLKCVPVT